MCTLLKHYCNEMDEKLIEESVKENLYSKTQYREKCSTLMSWDQFI